VAFTVRATYPDGRPVEDLSPSQRWRGVAYNQYDSGKWGRTEGAPVAAAGAAVPLRPGPDYALPELGPDQYVLDFTPRMRRASPILADPAAWAVGVPPPVCAVLRDGGRHAWWQASDGSFRPIRAADIRAGYRQVTRPPAEPDLGPPFALSVPLPEALHQLQSPIVIHRSARLPRLRSWTVDRLTELARTDPRVQAALDRADRRVNFYTDPADYEVVARALCEYLRTSPEYTYTLKLRRQDRASDPIEDFLFRTKAGHCERFAAGLALMLRSVGVPASYVLGFKGAEYDGDGVYVVRQEHAHAWVEVLVPRPTPRPPPPWAQGRPEVWHWLSLDPTPGGDEGADAESLAGQLGAARETLVEFFLDFIVGYNPERRREAVDAFWAWVRRNAGWLIGLPAAVVLAAAGRRLWRRVRGWERAANGGAGTGLAWFDRLGWVLARYGHPSPVGATPAEHAAAVTEHLRGDRRTAAVADVPLEVTRAFYLARYGDRPPGPAEAARLAAEVDRLEAALRSAPRRLPSP
jgi:transglutaminase-like putative cysteine protease